MLLARRSAVVPWNPSFQRAANPQPAFLSPLRLRKAHAFFYSPLPKSPDPALFDCFREKTRSISNMRSPRRGPRGFWKGSIVRWVAPLPLHSCYP
jgi:hypothetical protein